MADWSSICSSLAVRPKSLVHYPIVGCCLKMDKTFWRCSTLFMYLSVLFLSVCLIFLPFSYSPYLFLPPGVYLKNPITFFWFFIYCAVFYLVLFLFIPFYFSTYIWCIPRKSNKIYKLLSAVQSRFSCNFSFVSSRFPLFCPLFKTSVYLENPIRYTS